MNGKTMGWVLLVVGVILLILGLTADILGLGNQDGFGYKQTTTMVVGLVAAVAGGIIVTRTRSRHAA